MSTNSKKEHSSEDPAHTDFIAGRRNSSPGHRIGSGVGYTGTQLDVSVLFNYPCQYQWAGTSGDPSCYVGGNCKDIVPGDPSYVSASWYDDWSCSSGYVVASGQASIDYLLYYPAGYKGYLLYPVGLIVNDRTQVTAFVQGWSVYSNYNGYDGTDCLGGVQYFPQGGYEYDC
ncbi:MAG TPA: hypothetical protein VKX45_14740 [Bryobacteraceae bacterium]|nr:hypothetical protein [Bryobacteraceae bacterium]